MFAANFHSPATNELVSGLFKFAVKNRKDVAGENMGVSGGVMGVQFLATINAIKGEGRMTIGQVLKSYSQVSLGCF